MSYTHIEELPSEVRKSFEMEDQATWMGVYNEACDRGLSPFESRTFAWENCTTLESSRFVCANVSTEVVDDEGDLADVKSYVDSGQSFVEDGGVMIAVHSNKVTGCVWKVEEGVDDSTLKPCVIAYMNYFRGTPMYDQEWEAFKGGRNQFSIASLTKRPERECSSKGCYFRLIPEQWYELSNVDRGINPLTYPIAVNEYAKGDIGADSEECPLKSKYINFKDQMKQYGYPTSYGDYGEQFIVVHGILGEDQIAVIHDVYPDMRYYDFSLGEAKGESDSEGYTIILSDPMESTHFLGEIVTLIEDEYEAIEGYARSLGILRNTGVISGEDDERVSALFNEIITDEKRHIGNLLEVIRIIDPSLNLILEEGADEAREVMNKSQEFNKAWCPAGQHEHAGVEGCHDILRRHHVEGKTTPSDQMDLTDANIEIPAIKDASTEELRGIVTRVANILSKFGDKIVQEFLSTTPGKEFVLAFLEIKRREKQESVKMEEINKGAMPDIQSSIANIASTLASVTAVIDQMNIRMMKMEESVNTNPESEGSITDAILAEAQGGQAGTMPVEGQAPTQGDGNEIGIPQEEAPIDEEGKPLDEEGKPLDEDGEGEDDEEGEVKKDKNPFADSGEEGDDAESKDEDDKSEDKEDGKEEDEKKSEDDDEESEDDDEESEEEKGNPDEEEEAEPKEKGGAESEDEGGDGVEDGKDGLKEKEDVVKGVEEDSEGGTEGAPEPKKGEGEEGADGEPEGDVDEGVKKDASKSTSKDVQPEKGAGTDEFEYPIPRGGEAVDFRAMLLERRAELKIKGVELNIKEEGVQNSLSNQHVVNIKGENVSLVHPNNKVPAFDIEKGVTPEAKPNPWDNLGKYDSETFLKKLIGE